ncbi:MAG: hypothetical protein EA355_10035 [Rhodobacteraceae bacterium]|nr:MAG: hypothetical protein EA355_10035 [Paracoccaceae bacterium]
MEHRPDRAANTFRIMRVEGRPGLIDPRGARAPRPKTPGREIGPVFGSMAFPRLVPPYAREHRDGWRVSRRGQRIKDWSLSHPYLVVDSCGAPLATRSATNDAARHGIM